jgi:hypothetical protein
VSDLVLHEDFCQDPCGFDEQVEQDCEGDISEEGADGGFALGRKLVNCPQMTQIFAGFFWIQLDAHLLICKFAHFPSPH